MSASTGVSMKPYGEDSSPPALPAPIVKGACPDICRTSPPVPGGSLEIRLYAVGSTGIGESFGTLLIPGGWLI